ncbi:aldo/keto reductase [Chitinispirillales bacterium ANBcel5]|uniref:aldo/keto reductase n=1 Tax=Cellulosispirillum alkaliphilum TaxID=3039283 RepID=UPI002A58CEDC|nr:aldo/keto reductase [Chitinispirillales bacterium ANBcel5]
MSFTTIEMKSGHTIPVLGLGTWKLTGNSCFTTVMKALEIGYRHIDTAAAYGNEDQVGKALKKSGLKRSDLFITTKIWYDSLKYQDVLKQFDQSMQKLNCEYIDLLLIHWPNETIPLEETLEAFQKLVETAGVRSIGVSNFSLTKLKKAIGLSSLPLCTNQVEFHPFLNQKELLKYCKNNGVVLTAYCPIARGHVFKDPLLQSIAREKQINEAGLSLAYLMQKGMVVIPKASSASHLLQNYAAKEVSLSTKEIELIDTCNRDQRLVNPQWAEF